MNTLKNQVQLIGYLGNDPIIKTSANGNNYATARLATNDLFKNKAGEWVEEVQWHSLVFWGKQSATIEKKCTKGTQLLITGKLTYRDYEDALGQRRYVTEIKVENFIVLSETISKNSPEEHAVEEADIPF